MSELELKQDIARSLNNCLTGNLADGAQSLFRTLGYQTDKSIRLETPTAQAFVSQFTQEKSFNAKAAHLSDWRFVDLLFQLTKDEITGSGQIRLNFGDSPSIDNTIIESYLFFAIELAGSTYARSQLASITREINKLFPMPVMLVLKHGHTLTFSIINRRLHKRDESRDVLEKVTLIRDIDCANPHRVHIEILFNLSLAQLYKNHKFSNFVELHRAWQKTLDSTELNKRFFQEISDWYFWAQKHVRFPDDAPKDEDGLDSVSLIRLITRLIFVWFLKEKRQNSSLVPDELFQLCHLKELIDLDDRTTSTYYKAILQNLFFVTLNQEMNTPEQPENRKFQGKAKPGSRDQHFIMHNVYRYRDLFKQPERALQLFEQVPFLNGGLFECLDQPDPTNPTKILRIDGFSDRADNPLSVPNFLFFSDEQDVDLNKVHSTARRHFKVRGLIDIFNRYKFTITENTPLEEEIALDPELLGKVFENLLAAYNPETEETARKQTGSFYTPREVVDYMVDESLLVYLQNVLCSTNEKNELRERLRQLLDYQNPGNPFANNPEITQALVQAIDSLKVLDPAVGSGAFPMGMLQKLVFILSKLDPNNALWKAQQKEREIRPVLEDLQQEQKISYEKAREAAVKQLKDRLAQIETDFDNNEMDYPRKLFLIENSIHGVDIQPIAVQIAKLRFFISLIVEQRVDDTAPNRGILPLPNLETKFICANTLIGINRPDQLSFGSHTVQKKEQELAQVRHRIFTARTQATKNKYRQRDRELREEIAALLKREGWIDNTATQLAQWNPYDQNASASFFDSEWMFGIRDGFDIVIGNPPYVRQEQIKHLKQQLKPQYECFTGTADLYVFFYEKGLKLLREHGVLTFISSNKWFRSAYGKKLRQLITRETQLQQIIDFGDASVFAAIAYPTIVITQKGKPSSPTPFSLGAKGSKTDPVPLSLGIGARGEGFLALNWGSGQALEQFETVVQTQSFLMPQAELKAESWQFADTATMRLLEKLRKAGTPLGEYVKGRFYRGIVTGLNEAFVVDRDTRDRLIAEHPSSAEVLKPFVRGRDVKRWVIDYQDLWLIFTRRGIDIEEYPAIENHLRQYKDKLENRAGDAQWFELQASPADTERFERSKVFIPAIAQSADYAADYSGYFGNDKTNICVTDEVEFILGIFNSKIMWWFIQQIAASKQSGFYELKPMYVTQIPIPSASEQDKRTIETIVNYILYLTTEFKHLPNHGENLMTTADDKLMLSYFEQLIDVLVMELYLRDELHSYSKQFMHHFQQENLPKLEQIKGDKMNVLRDIFRRLFDREHPVRENIFFLDSVPEVRIIRGLK